MVVTNGDSPRTQRGVAQVLLHPGGAQMLTVPHDAAPLGVGLVDGVPTLFIECRLPARPVRRKALVVPAGVPFEDESLEHAGSWQMRAPDPALIAPAPSRVLGIARPAHRVPAGRDAALRWFHLFLGPEEEIAEDGDEG